MDSSKEFEEVLRGSINGLTYFHSEADIPGVEEYNPSQAEQRILAAHHKATQARVREVTKALPKPKDILPNAYWRDTQTVSVAKKEEHLSIIEATLKAVRKAIDAELSKLGERE